jgi:hypothetical protein
MSVGQRTAQVCYGVARMTFHRELFAGEEPHGQGKHHMDVFEAGR